MRNAGFNSFVEWAYCPLLIFFSSQDTHPTDIHPASQQWPKITLVVG
ncbi:MAG: hypothetical protein F6K23_20885 [Okeania sp. SIO2C9]|nr:hypothetical protein [Okeania sp. SIO2C9]NEQ75284.1 hypothetical protein [Okeania sp. SIO2C9]